MAESANEINTTYVSMRANKWRVSYSSWANESARLIKWSNIIGAVSDSTALGLLENDSVAPVREEVSRLKGR